MPLNVRWQAIHIKIENATCYMVRHKYKNESIAAVSSTTLNTDMAMPEYTSGKKIMDVKAWK